MFLDDDDWLGDDFIAEQVRGLAQTTLPAPVAGIGTRVFVGGHGGDHRSDARSYAKGESWLDDSRLDRREHPRRPRGGAAGHRRLRRGAVELGARGPDAATPRGLFDRAQPRCRVLLARGRRDPAPVVVLGTGRQRHRADDGQARRQDPPRPPRSTPGSCGPRRRTASWPATGPAGSGWRCGRCASCPTGAAREDAGPGRRRPPAVHETRGGSPAGGAGRSPCLPPCVTGATLGGGGHRQFRCADGRPAEVASLTVREATDGDLPAVLDLLQASLGWVPDDDYARFFAWKHHESPFGRSPAWVAVDPDADGRIVGFRTFSRWRFDQGGRHGRRPSGPSTPPPTPTTRAGASSRCSRARRSTSCAAEGVGFVFNTPNDKSRPGYLKMGWQLVERLPVAATVRSPRSLVRLARARTPADKWSAPTRRRATRWPTCSPTRRDRDALLATAPTRRRPRSAPTARPSLPALALRLRAARTTGRSSAPGGIEDGVVDLPGAAARRRARGGHLRADRARGRRPHRPCARPSRAARDSGRPRRPDRPGPPGTWAAARCRGRGRRWCGATCTRPTCRPPTGGPSGWATSSCSDGRHRPHLATADPIPRPARAGPAARPAVRPASASCPGRRAARAVPVHPAPGADDGRGRRARGCRARSPTAGSTTRRWPSAARPGDAPLDHPVHRRPPPPKPRRRRHGPARWSDPATWGGTRARRGRRRRRVTAGPARRRRRGRRRRRSSRAAS